MDRFKNIFKKDQVPVSELDAFIDHGLAVYVCRAVPVELLLLHL